MRGASTTVRMIYSRAAASGPYCARAGADDAREAAKRLASGIGAPTGPPREHPEPASAIHEPAPSPGAHVLDNSAPAWLALELMRPYFWSETMAEIHGVHV